MNSAVDLEFSTGDSTYIANNIILTDDYISDIGSASQENPISIRWHDVEEQE
ncbi:hypothetical protein [Natronorubrum halalkaliphilum]|uniref:hypothetical protein n=1 Tax=Natronorubrum halalkaliphilum TaxID=2691917 RepID=UPI00135AB884|nr:hypothetical protein [Natronorubrum halalkaliphilum]